MLENVEKWMITSIVLDILVIIANCFEQNFMRKYWRNLGNIDYFLLSLSISDLLFGISTLSIDCWYFYHLVNKLQPNVHRLLDTLFLFSLFSGLFHASLIAVERVVSICIPQRDLFKSKSVRSATLVSIWLIALLISLVFCLVNEERFGPYARATLMLITTIIIFAAYISIALFLLRIRFRYTVPASVAIPQNPQNTTAATRSGSNTSTDSDTSMSSNRQTDSRQVIKRSTIACLLIGFSNVVCVMPFCLGFYKQQLSHPIGDILIVFNSVLNPCIYLGMAVAENNSQRQRSGTLTYLLGAGVSDEEHMNNCVEEGTNTQVVHTSVSVQEFGDNKM